MSPGRTVCGVGFVLTTMYFSKVTIDWFEGCELSTAIGILTISWPGGIALSQAIHPLVSVEAGGEGQFPLRVFFVLEVLLLFTSFTNHQNPSSRIPSQLTRKVNFQKKSGKGVF